MRRMLLKRDRRCSLLEAVSHLKNSAGMVSGPVALPFLSFFRMRLSSLTVMGGHLDLVGACDGGGGACVLCRGGAPMLVLKVLRKGLSLLEGIDYVSFSFLSATDLPA